MPVFAEDRLAVERLKNEFISTVSHELRTPLTSIRGALALVMSGAAGELPAKAKELLTVAHRNSERLIHIVNDILDAEKIEAGKMRINIQKVSLRSFLHETVVYNEPYAEKFKVQFRLLDVPDIQISTDPDRLMQVITNLLSNAAKFSPAGAEVLVCARANGSKIIVEVRDHGPGIPEEFRPHIFGKFAQALNGDKPRVDGAGLGLNLSRQLVELMKGEIGFETKIGVGTTFFIKLPLTSEVL